MTEQELIEAICNRDEPAFRELVNRFQHKVYNTALGFLRSPADAEDLAQEVFIQVYRSIGSFRADSSLSTWIYRITVTQALSQLRSRKRKKRFGFVTALFGDNNQPLHEESDHDHPGVQQERKEDFKILMQTVNELPEKQRIAFLLNKIEDLSYREIADILNTTEAAVDALLQRAKQGLRKKLENLPP